MPKYVFIQILTFYKTFTGNKKNLIKNYVRNNEINVSVHLMSNSALLYNKDHNLLTSAFPPKHVKLIKFPLKKLNISCLVPSWPHALVLCAQVSCHSVNHNNGHYSYQICICILTVHSPLYLTEAKCFT